MGGSNQAGSGPRPRVGIGIMCKPPRPGLSKTRLAVDLGSEAAARLAKAFLQDVIATVEHFAVDRDIGMYAFYRPADAEVELTGYFPAGTRLFLQDDADLGLVMRSAIERMLMDCPGGAIVVGADVPHIPVQVFGAAVSLLNEEGPCAVIGPSGDGGYYLIGMSDSSSGHLLDPLPWSTPEVYRLTEQRARERGSKLLPLERLYDVDDHEGLARLISSLERLPDSVAIQTRAVLKSLVFRL